MFKLAGTLFSETRPGSVLTHRLPSLWRSSLRGEESPGSWNLPGLFPSLQVGKKYEEDDICLHLFRDDPLDQTI
jgi:hypothetical protein